MSYAIPEPYCWDESFRVFYDNIDDEHKGLFDGIFKCAKSPSDKAALSTLLAAVKTHFSTEESMFAKANYENTASHTKIHKEFVDTLKTLSTPLADDTIAFAKKWLVEHIKGIDFKYKGKL